MKLRMASILSIVMMLGTPSAGNSKCGMLLITIEVEVRGQVKAGQSIMVDIEPEAYWSFQLAGSSPNHFVIQIPFGTFSGRNASGMETCERTPRTIAVMLQDWLQTVDALELTFPDDFAADKDGHYHARGKVVLDVNHVGPPWIRKSKRAALKTHHVK